MIEERLEFTLVHRLTSSQLIFWLKDTSVGCLASILQISAIYRNKSRTVSIKICNEVLVVISDCGQSWIVFPPCLLPATYLKL